LIRRIKLGLIYKFASRSKHVPAIYKRSVKR